MQTVILAEKPSQAKDYAAAMQKSVRKNGYYEVNDPIFQGKVLLTWAVGHLVELDLPGEYCEKWEKWSLESLPIIPESFQYHVTKDTSDQFKIIKELLEKADEVIIATDIDREGEHVAWSILNQCSFPKEKVTKRLWINDQLPETIREGFSNLLPAKSTYRFYTEAQTRQYSDWLIGMNASPLYSLHLQKLGISDSFSVGRVQTPTLFLVYQREQEIMNFKKATYYEVGSTAKTDKQESFQVKMTPGQKFTTKTELSDFLQVNELSAGSHKAIVEQVQTEEKEQGSPSLFTLTGLQKQMNKQHKLTAKETLTTVQELYEKKLLSYPRSDCKYITMKSYEVLLKALPEYLNLLKMSDVETVREPSKKYVDDKKVAEHYAIIPTKKVPTEEELSALSNKEQQVYQTVLKQTVAMFLTKYQYKETTILLKAGNLRFKAIGKVPISEGWKQLFPLQEEKALILPSVQEQEEISLQLSAEEKETTPPKRYTENSLLARMENVDKVVEDSEEKEVFKDIKGLGMPSTRAEIIEGLKKRNYIKLEKNQLCMTEKGTILCAAVSFEKLLSTPSMTATWESSLKKIGQSTEGNELLQEKFLTNITNYIQHLIQSVPEAFESVELESALEKYRETQEKCPKCGQFLKRQKKFIGCSNYPTCKFTLSLDFRGKKLTSKNIKDLLEGKKTKVTKIKSKGKETTYDAFVQLNEKGFVEFKEFAKSKSKK